MRPLILQMSMFLDGCVVAPEGHGGSAFHGGDEVTDWKLRAVREAGVHIMGRNTYEEMAAHWPSSTEAYAAPMNETPKVVFSHSLQSADWDETEIVRGDIDAEITALKEQAGGPILAHGGAGFVQSLTRLGLVDEYRFLVSPVAFGAGRGPFDELRAPRQLELVEATPFEGGAIGQVYRPAE